MKIAYFIDHLRADGAQKYLSQLVAGLGEGRQHEQTIFCLNNSYDIKLVSKLERSGADVLIIGKMSLLTGSGWLKMVSVLRETHFDVVITCLFVSDVIGRFLGRVMHVPKIITAIQNRNVKYSSLQRRLIRFTMRWVDTVILNSANVREFAIKHEDAPPEETYIIPNAIDIEAYSVTSDRDDVRNELDIPPCGVLIGSIGRLAYQKGYDVLLEALSLLPSGEWQLLLVGTGELRDDLVVQAETLGIRDQVAFAGYRHDVPRLLNVIDLYVQPSRFEGMPNAVLEAMAAGCSIIATSVDGITELIEDGVNGRLVPPENPTALTTAIGELLNDPNVTQQFGAAARKRARAFGTRKLISAWEEILRDDRKTMQETETR